MKKIAEVKLGIAGGKAILQKDESEYEGSHLSIIDHDGAVIVLGVTDEGGMRLVDLLEQEVSSC